jgi:hypothetical protein
MYPMEASSWKFVTFCFFQRIGLGLFVVYQVTSYPQIREGVMIFRPINAEARISGKRNRAHQYYNTLDLNLHLLYSAPGSVHTSEIPFQKICQEIVAVITGDKEVHVGSLSADPGAVEHE